MNVGEQVQVKADSLPLWEGESMLTPAAIVKLGYPNRFEVVDVIADPAGEYLVLPCCKTFKVSGKIVCHGHPVEYFEPYEVDVTTAEPETAPLGDKAETSLHIGGGTIGALGYTREEGGKLYVRLPFFGEIALKGEGSRLAAQGLRGLGWL